MKRFKSACILLAISATLGLSAAGIESVALNNLMAGITRAREPVVSGRYVVFTAAGNARFAGIAFDFERYGKTHSFQRLIRRDADGETLENLLFFIAEIPPETSEIRYRMVIDGLWTTDPLNAETGYDYANGMSVSRLRVPSYEVFKTAQKPSGCVRFTWEGKSGKRVTLAGTFNGWDPFMYELEEIAPGRYELDLPLPPGTWYYAYFEGTDQLQDPNNDDRVYTKDGRVASVVTVAR